MLCKYTIGHFAKLGSLFCGCHPFFQFRSPCFIEEVAKAEIVTRGCINMVERASYAEDIKGGVLP